MASPATGRASLDAPDRDGYRWPAQKEWDAIESAFSREHLRRLYPQAYEHPAYAARFKGVRDKLFQPTALLRGGETRCREIEVMTIDDPALDGRKIRMIFRTGR